MPNKKSSNQGITEKQKKPEWVGEGEEKEDERARRKSKIRYMPKGRKKTKNEY